MERIPSKFYVFDNISYIYGVLNSKMHPPSLLGFILLIFNLYLIHKQIPLFSFSQIFQSLAIKHIKMEIYSKEVETNVIYIFTSGKSFQT